MISKLFTRNKCKQGFLNCNGITARIKNNDIIVTNNVPDITARIDPCIGDNSITLSLDGRFKIIKSNMELDGRRVINSTMGVSTKSCKFNKCGEDGKSYFIINNDECVIVSFNERVYTPNKNIIKYVQLMPKLTKLGLKIDNNIINKDGEIEVTISNTSKYPVIVCKDQKVLSMYFYQIGE